MVDGNIAAKEHLMKSAKKTGRIFFKIFRTYLIIALSFVVLYPVFYMISMSFRPVDEYTNPSIIWIPATWTLEVMKNAWETIKLPSTIWNSALITLVNTVVSIVPCCLAGYGLARFEFKFKKLLMIMLVISILVPTQTIIVPLYAKMRYFDFFFIGQIGRLLIGDALSAKLLDTDWAMLIMSLFGSGIRGGMFIFIFRQFFSGLPRDLEDAAYVDGGGSLQTFLRVIIPCASAPFLVVLILSLIWHWNDNFVAPLLNSSRQTLAFTIDNLANISIGANANVYERLQIRLASCIYLIAPILILYLFLQRYFVESIDRTGLK